MLFSPQLVAASRRRGGAGGGGFPGGTEAQAFLARTSGLDTTHQNAYAALIDGLVADSVWPKFDMLHVYATQDGTTALLNLVSMSYNGTLNGSPSRWVQIAALAAGRGHSEITLDVLAALPTPESAEARA